MQMTDQIAVGERCILDFSEPALMKTLWNENHSKGSLFLLPEMFKGHTLVSGHRTTGHLSLLGTKVRIVGSLEQSEG